LRGHLGTGAKAGRQRSLAREYHAPGDEPARPRTANAAAGNDSQHQSDRLLCGPAAAADTIRRQALGAVRGFGVRRVSATSLRAALPSNPDPALAGIALAAIGKFAIAAGEQPGIPVDRKLGAGVDARGIA